MVVVGIVWDGDCPSQNCPGVVEWWSGGVVGWWSGGVKGELSGHDA